MKFVRFGVLTPQKQVNYGKDTFHSPPCKYGFYAFPEHKIEMFLIGATDNINNSSSKTAWLKDNKGNKIQSDTFFEEYHEYVFDNGLKLKEPCVNDNTLSYADNHKVLYSFLEEHGLTRNNILSEEWYNVPKKEYKPLLKKYNIRKNYYLSSQKDGEIKYVTYLKEPKKFQYNGDIWHHHLEYIKNIDIIDKKGTWVKTSIKSYQEALKKSESEERFKSVFIGYEKLKTDKFKGILSRHKNYFNRDHYEVFIEKIK